MASLAKEINKSVAKNKGKKLSAVLNFTGDTTDEYLEKVKAFAKKNKLDNIAVTTTADARRFRVSEDASLTVMHYVGKKVAYNFATDKKVSKKDVAAIIGGTKKILE